MKKLFAAPLLFAILLFSNNANAHIWRVDNNAGVNTDYTTVQAAHDAATTLAGDTLHIEPSANGYGILTVTKPLVIIGNGYFLTGANGNLGLQANTNNSIFNYIDFEPGSAGSTVQGVITTSLYLETPNILVRRNYIVNWIYVYTAGNNCTITENYFSYGFQQQTAPATITVTNNIFVGSTNVGLNVTSTGTFENNTCYNGSVSLSQFQVDNNIFYATNFTPNNSVYFNNIGDATQFGNANGNQQNVVMTNVFQGGASTDAQYILKAGSPAIGAGQGGVDCGAFGGPNPYVVSGIPNVPTIYSLTVPPTGTTNINVTISTKSNN